MLLLTNIPKASPLQPFVLLDKAFFFQKRLFPSRLEMYVVYKYFFGYLASGENKQKCIHCKRLQVGSETRNRKYCSRINIINVKKPCSGLNILIIKAKKNLHCDVTINFLPIHGMTPHTVVNKAVETYNKHCTAAIRLVRILDGRLLRRLRRGLW
jgi:hypothetical protein